jgi:hypothetical protein
LSSAGPGPGTGADFFLVLWWAAPPPELEMSPNRFIAMRCPDTNVDALRISPLTKIFVFKDKALPLPTRWQ